ncbi:MAG: DPP IV N-terminal domain-containing protein [Elusimicrobia bacterium]|nr:DPP IV N-terminal domain-containing protein [Elusimicrobiota bacterium]
MLARRRFLAGLVLLPFLSPARAWTLENAEYLEQYAATYRFALGRPAEILVSPDGRHVYFLRSGPRSFTRDLYEFDVEKGQERRLLSAEELLAGQQETLTAEEAARRERQRLVAKGIASYRLSKDGRRLLVPLSGRLFVYEISSGKILELKGDPGSPIDPQFSPDASKVAYAKNGELYVADPASGAEKKITFGAGKTVSNAEAEFVAQEEMGRGRGFWWSPDGKWLAYQQTDCEGLEEFHIADLKNPEKAVQSWFYPRTGRKNAKVRLGLIAVTGGPTVWIDWDREKFPYLAAVEWEGQAPLTILVQNRPQTEEQLLAVDLPGGTTRVLLKETDKTWLNLAPGMPRWLADGTGFLWASERRGEWELELRSAKGDLERTLAKKGFGFRKVAGVDAQDGFVYVQASTEPLEGHLYRVSLPPNKGEVLRLTQEPGLHDAVFAENGGRHVLISRGLFQGPQYTVHDKDGKALAELHSLAENPPYPPNVELTEAAAPQNFRAALVRPENFDSSRRYPVLVQVYGGPGGAMVLAAQDRYLLPQWFADQGFVVVSLDGRGTPGRGRDWERAIKGNFIQVPLEDQVQGLRGLCERYPELDCSRVGIMGWSFGGYMAAMAAMQRPEVYQAAAAGAPVADWLDYDTHYTERYLGLPEENAEGYAKSSALSYAKDLNRPLLLIHGTTDDNVYFMHSLKLSDALFRAGRDHEFLPLASFTHMVPDPQVIVLLNQRLARFFIQNLQ